MFEAVGSIAIFVLVLTILVVIHEAGHFFVAKAAGVKVLEFGVGFPPRLWGIRRGETLYSVNAIPLGGFVKMLGEENPDEPGSLAGKSAGIRLLVMAAGPAMNIILAAALFTLLFMLPQDVRIGDLLVQEVELGSPAQEAGILPGDIILEASGQELENHTDLIYLVNLKLGTEMTWIIRRGEQTIPVQVKPRFNPPEYQGAVDVLVGDVLIREVQIGSPAREAGILPGDVILEVDGQALDDHIDLINLVGLNLGTEMTWTIQRGEQSFPVRLTPRVNPPEGQGAVGITLGTVNYRVESRPEPPSTVTRRGFARVAEVGATITTANFHVENRSYPPWTAAGKGITRMGEVLILVKNAVTNWVSGGEQPFAGPVGIGHVFVEVGQAEGLSFGDRALFIILIAGVLSMMLGFFNILPIPALDGGRILFVAIEVARRGKRISPEREGMIHMVGFIVLITFILFITFVDLTKLGDNLLGG